MLTRLCAGLSQEGMQSEDTATRQGVCYGIQEVLKSVTRQQLSDMLPAVLPVIQTALCDDDASVRTVSLLKHQTQLSWWH